MKIPTRIMPDWSWWVGLGVGFWLGIGVLHVGLRYIRSRVYFDMDQYWPISIFLPKVPAWPVDVLIVVGLAVMWWGVLKLWNPKRMSIWSVIVIVGALLVGTNALQGWEEGFVKPYEQYDESYVHYYKDAVKITDVGSFLAYYHELQPNLRDHSRVHPPGALLVFWGLASVWNTPFFVGGVFAIGGLMSLWFVYDLLKPEIGHESSLLTVMLMGTMAGFQIYFWYMFDTLVVLVFIAATWSFVREKWWLCVLFFLIGGMLTFAVVWLAVMLLIFEWWRDRRIEKTMWVGIGVGFGLILIWWFTGFSYGESFLVAKSFESPEGFYLFVDPASYVQTRFEDLLEPFVFMGPWIGWLVIKGGLSWKRHPWLGKFGLSALGAFVFFLLGGAYYTGETARAAAFLYPFYLMLAGIWIYERKPTVLEQKLLLSLVFGQSVLMQMFGWYAW